MSIFALTTALRYLLLKFHEFDLKSISSNMGLRGQGKINMTSVIERADSKEFIIWEDLSELARSGLEYPAVAVCNAIWSVVEPVINDRRRRDRVHLAIGEIVKDVDLHGDESYPRLVTLRREMGGLAIDTENRPQERTRTLYTGEEARYDSQRYEWHIGRELVEEVFGDRYRYEEKGGVYMVHAEIPVDVDTSQGLLKIEHVV